MGTFEGHGVGGQVNETPGTGLFTTQYLSALSASPATFEFKGQELKDLLSKLSAAQEDISIQPQTLRLYVKGKASLPSELLLMLLIFSECNKIKIETHTLQADRKAKLRLWEELKSVGIKTSHLSSK